MRGEHVAHFIKKCFGIVFAVEVTALPAPIRPSSSQAIKYLASVSLADKAVVLLKALECLVIGFLPPENFSVKKAFIGDACPENRFELLFDAKVDGPVLENLFKTKENIISKYNHTPDLSVEMDEDELSEEEELDDDDE